MTSTWYCPLDCSRCSNVLCLSEGCQRVAAAALIACEACGTLLDVRSAPVCAACTIDIRAPARRRSRTAARKPASRR